MVRLHREHGLNPSIKVCYWCGKEGGIMLLGAAYKGKAPTHMVTSKEPCGECKKLAAQGIVIAEVKNGESGDNPNRTGRMIVLKEKAFVRMFGKVQNRFCYMEEELFSKLMPPAGVK